MQSSRHAHYSYPYSATTSYRNKHGRDSEDEEAIDEQRDDSDNTVAGGLRGAGRVHFAAEQVQQDGQQFQSAVKRRKTAHLGFEPVLQGLSLDNEQTGYLYAEQVISTAEEVDDDVPELRGRGRTSSRRETTPFPGVNNALRSDVFEPPEHRRRSTSRNRARVRSNSRDATMSRYDPARPHVVYVDTLSDSDDGDSPLPGSSRSATVPSTRNNSPSSDGEEVIPPSSASRPIHLNRRLRDYLHRQQQGEIGPVPEGILSSAPSVHGSAVDERGLILYRPLSFGIVEEPEDRDEPVNPSGDLRIQELPSSSAGDGMIADEDVEMEGAMEVD